MAELLMMFYGVAAVFVHGSLTANIKNQRPHAKALVLAGWSVMSCSLTLAASLSVYIAYIFLTAMPR